MHSKAEPIVSERYALPDQHQIPHRNGDRIPKTQTANRRSTCAPPSSKPANIDQPAPSNEDPVPGINNPGTSIEQPASTIHKRIRHGKIARLPFIQRDMVNRMLRDHIPYKAIVNALDEHGIRVTERNVSNWKTRGGYQAWRFEQERALGNRLIQDNLLEHVRKTDAYQLSEVGLQIAATNLSQFLLKPETQNCISTTPAVCHQTIAELCRLSRHILALQKYRDESAKELGYRSNPERVRRQEEKDFELTRNIYSAAEIDDKTIEPIPRRNFISKELSPELPKPIY